MSDLTTFQRLAELSETDPFYLVIVTHKSEGIFAENDNDKKLLGRFVSPTCLIEFPIWTLKYVDDAAYVVTDKRVIDKAIDLLSELAKEFSRNMLLF